MASWLSDVSGAPSTEDALAFFQHGPTLHQGAQLAVITADTAAAHLAGSLGVRTGAALQEVGNA